MEHAPGPRGSPHVPHVPPALASCAPSPPTAKLESCWLSRLLAHLGQAAFWLPRTIASNRWSHCWQMYSKIGILNGSFKIVATPYYKDWNSSVETWLRPPIYPRLTSSSRGDICVIATP